MKTAAAVNVKDWLYGLTKGMDIGRQPAKGVYARPNRNFDTILTEPVLVRLDATTDVTLPVGTGLTVFRQLVRTASGWQPLPDAVLAVIFIKDGVRTVEQITIRTTGRVLRRKP